MHQSRGRLSEHFLIGASTVWLELTDVDDDGQPVVRTSWSPRPARMTLEACREFDERRRDAIARLRQRWQDLQEPKT